MTKTLPPDERSVWHFGFSSALNLFRISCFGFAFYGVAAALKLSWAAATVRSRSSFVWAEETNIAS
jgi:hypothetical protein